MVRKKNKIQSQNSWRFINSPLILLLRFTGYSTMKIGKTAAFLIGGGIIFLEVANEQGWIRIDCKLLFELVVQLVVKLKINFLFQFREQIIKRN